MKKSKFSEHQIINILKEYESGKATKDICREHGISAPTFYQWKQKYGGMDAQHLKELRVLNVIDDYNRESLINEAFYSIPGVRLVQRLKELITYRPKPKRIRTDNGPEFLSKVFVDFCKDNDVELQYIQPGKPAQNAYIERLNRTFREDVLDAYLFSSLVEVNAIAYEWQTDYNSNHPHKSLNGLSPWLYAKEVLVY